MKQFAVHALRTKAHPVVLAVAAVALVVPSIWTGWQQDDQVHRYLFLYGAADTTVRQHSLDPFRFVDGDTARTHEFMDMGLVPWWTLPGIRLSFWRPVAALTQWADYHLWPQSSVLMHLQSLFWFAALVFVVAFLYRKFLGATWVAGLAGLFFALDDAHGLPAGWLANRNALIAALFGVVALLAHDRWRRDRWRPGMVFAPFFLLLALLSGESGLAICAYLLGYALFLDETDIRSRGVSLVPYAAIAVAWLITYSALGCGTSGSGFYVDPFSEPFRFLLAVLWKAPLLLADQLAFPPSFFVLFAPRGVLVFLWLWALILLSLLFALIAPLLRHNRMARFWFTGTILSIPFACATVPHGRLLTLAGVGGFGLLALWIEGVSEHKSWVPRKRWWENLAAPAVVILLVIHLVIAPVLLPLNATSAAFAQKYIQDPATRISAGPELPNQDLIVLNHPIVFYAHQSLTSRFLARLPAPRHLRVLAPAILPVHYYRPDSSTLVVRPEGGFLTAPFDDVFRGPAHPLRKGEVVCLAGMTVVVTDTTTDRRPAEVAFHFPVSLTAGSLRWLQWQHRGYVPFLPPAVGDSGVAAGSPLEL